ncbi:ATP-binding protein [Modestobacter sp. SSW1-42]|uniref:ATP-binding protein n=1 Tax=Modestobacter sp. SSW1-42 TaxID=596372 RepID=UPI003985E1BB
MRARLRPIVPAQSAAAGPGAATDDLERILLVVEELASNGLRHGDPPVEITLCATASGWLLAVSDTAADRPPTLAVDRDPADGGMGLYLVARLASAHGWTVGDGRKSVWALVERLIVPHSASHVPA